MDLNYFETELDMCVSLIDSAKTYDDMESVFSRYENILEHMQSSVSTIGVVSQGQLFSSVLPYISMLTNAFDVRGYQYLAESVLLKWWSKISVLRIAKSKGQVYLAGIAVMLCDYYSKHNDIARAIRWCLMAHADDCLRGDSNLGARKRLKMLFGLSKEADAIEEYAAQSSTLAAYCEHITQKVLDDHKSLALSFPVDNQEFYISTTYLRAILDYLEDVKDDLTVKGRVLEDIAAYVVSLLPGFYASRNLRSQAGITEYDVVAHNYIPQSNLYSELLGRTFLIECKNWEKPVGVEQVGYFLHRMQLAHSDFGIMLCKSGITGNEDEERAARALIRYTFHETGKLCVVLAYEDLDELQQSENPSFWRLLLDKIEEFQYGTRL